MSRALSLAGFEVTLIGRFWVIPEGMDASRIWTRTFTCTWAVTIDASVIGRPRLVRDVVELLSNDNFMGVDLEHLIPKLKVEFTTFWRLNADFVKP
jgi:hypothetical protein